MVHCWGRLLGHRVWRGQPAGGHGQAGAVHRLDTAICEGGINCNCSLGSTSNIYEYIYLLFIQVEINNECKVM